MQDKECIMGEIIERQPALSDDASNREVVTQVWDAFNDCGCADCQRKVADAMARAAAEGKDVLDWQVELADKLFMAVDLAVAERDWVDRADQMRWGHAGA